MTTISFIILKIFSLFGTARKSPFLQIICHLATAAFRFDETSANFSICTSKAPLSPAPLARIFQRFSRFAGKSPRRICGRCIDVRQTPGAIFHATSDASANELFAAYFLSAQMKSALRSAPRTHTHARTHTSRLFRARSFKKLLR